MGLALGPTAYVSNALICTQLIQQTIFQIRGWHLIVPSVNSQSIQHELLHVAQMAIQNNLILNTSKSLEMFVHFVCFLAVGCHWADCCEEQNERRISWVSLSWVLWRAEWKAHIISPSWVLWRAEWKAHIKGVTQLSVVKSRMKGAYHITELSVVKSKMKRAYHGCHWAKCCEEQMDYLQPVFYWSKSELTNRRNARQLGQTTLPQKNHKQPPHTLHLQPYGNFFTMCGKQKHTCTLEEGDSCSYTQENI